VRIRSVGSAYRSDATYPRNVEGQGADIRPFETDHEAGYEGPGWRWLAPSPPYEVEDAGQWRPGLLRMWRLWPDGWYGLIRWGDHHQPTWVPRARLRPSEYAKPKRTRDHR